MVYGYIPPEVCEVVCCNGHYYYYYKEKFDYWKYTVEHHPTFFDLKKSKINYYQKPKDQPKSKLLLSLVRKL